MNVVWHDNERQRFNMTRIMLVPETVDDNSSASKVLKYGLPFRRRGGYVISLIWDAASPFAKFTVAFHRAILAEWDCIFAVNYGANYRGLGERWGRGLGAARTGRS